MVVLCGSSELAGWGCWLLDGLQPLEVFIHLIHKGETDDAETRLGIRRNEGEWCGCGPKLRLAQW